MIGVASVLHYVTHPSQVLLHEAFQYLCYAPIIAAAYWYGAWGGLAAALFAAAAFIPHIRMTWATNPPYAASLYAQVIVFHALGVSVGILSSVERKRAVTYRDMAESLERANRELRESDEHLRRADRLSALGEMAAGLAHELRNPLASIKGSLEIVAARLAPGTPEAEFTHIASKEIARLDGLVTEFLTYARPRDPELRPARLTDVIEHVAGLLRSEADRAGAILSLETSYVVPPVLIDAEQMMQVVFNVVLNAIQASPPGGRVRVRERTDGGAALIEVIDEGPGIPPQHGSRIFDPFFTTKDRGTGLGLAIAHRVVTAHRGTIEAVPAPERGTIVRLRLPLPAIGEPVQAIPRAEALR